MSLGMGPPNRWCPDLNLVWGRGGREAMTTTTTTKAPSPGEGSAPGAQEWEAEIMAVHGL